MPVNDIIQLNDLHIANDLHDADNQAHNHPNFVNNNQRPVPQNQNDLLVPPLPPNHPVVMPPIGNEPQQHIPQTFAPAQMPGPDERAAIEAAVNQQNVFNWPAIAHEPVNEFNTEGYIACAFPALFPTGSADLNGPHMHKPTPYQYFTHLLRYHDDRFQADPRFVFLAYNTILRWRALEVGTVLVRNDPLARNLTVDDI